MSFWSNEWSRRPHRESFQRLSFKEEVESAIDHVVSIRRLIENSRAKLSTESSSDEETKKRKEAIEEIRKKISDMPAENIDGIIALGQSKTPIELREINQGLERLEFLLEDMKKGKDRRINLKNLVDSFKSISLIVYNALNKVDPLVRLIEGR